MDAIATDSPFTEEQERTLIALAGAIIPASAEYGLPGADDPPIAADILATAKRHPDAIVQALDLEDAVATAKHGTPFLDLDAAAQRSQIERANQARTSQDAEFDRAKLFGRHSTRSIVLSIVAQCYYRDDRVMRSLDMEPRSPFPDGFEVEQGDWSLLEPVKQRGKVYRDAPN